MSQEMKPRKIVAEIVKVTEKLIADSTTATDAQSCVESLLELVGQLCGQPMEELIGNGGSSETGSGVAISPYLAAKCMSIGYRTQQFLRGINAWLNEVKITNQPLDILYAGCGPYATLVFPLLCLHRDTPVNLTLIDIHDVSINSAVTLFSAADLENVTLQSCVADATKWTPEPEIQEYDLIVSETMNAALKEEPQVAIFRNLAAFLKPNGKLIPQQISVDAALTKGTEMHKLGPVFHLNRHSCEVLRTDNKAEFTGKIALPGEIKEQYSRLYISTDVHVYGSFHIGPEASDFTSGAQFSYLDFSEQNEISWTYAIAESPEFVFDLHFYQPPLPPATLDIKTQSGTPYLYAFWQSIVWDMHRSRLTEENQKHSPSINWDSVMAMIEAYQANLQLAMAKVLEKHPPSFSEFESWFIQEYGELNAAKRQQLNVKIAASL